MATNLEDAVTFAIARKVKASRIHLTLAVAFSVVLIGLCAGTFFYASKMGAASLGIASTILAMLVLALLSSSRSLSDEASRLGVLITDEGADARERILKELSLPQTDGATAALVTIRQAVLKKRG